MRRQLAKLRRDLWLTRGRVAFMVLSLAVGLTSLGTVLSMRGVLRREMTRNYLDTVPASATIDVGDKGVSSALLEQVRVRHEIAAAERRATLRARWRQDASRDWGLALLFIVEDFDKPQLALLKHEDGVTVPPLGSMLVERSAMVVLGAKVGDTIQVQVGSGAITEIIIAGVVHEPALAPAASEQSGYLYASVETLVLLGQPPTMDELRVLVADSPLDATSVENQVSRLAIWLQNQGTDVHEVKIPPPGKHPHEGPSGAILLLLAVFAGLTVLLAGVLSASLLSITMARQVREIAIMKTLGAVGWKIRVHYLLMLSFVAFAALALSVAPTILFGRIGVDSVANLLNFDIASYSVPSWVYVVQVVTGIVLPLLTAAPAILRASRISVRQALGDHGARPSQKAGSERWIGGFENRLLQAALRNAFRVPRRLLLTLGLLAVGGGLFVSAVSVADAWDEMTAQVFQTRHYDVELRLAETADTLMLKGVPNVGNVEVWGSSSVTLTTKSGLPVSRTYPDGGHGSFNLVAVPDNTKLIEFKQHSGRWLGAGERDGVVLNQLAASRVGQDPLGRNVEMAVEGRVSTWKVVGVVEEVAAPATAYVGFEAFVKKTGQPLRMLRIATTTNRETMSTHAAIKNIQSELAARGKHIVSAVPLQLLFNAMGEHVVVLIRLLLGLALLTAIVGVLALGSSMSTSVIERGRELGVLQAIGARPVQVRRMVLLEGLFVTLLSLPLALLIATAVSAVVGQIVGQLAFQLPLPLNLSWVAMAAWSAGVLLVASAASLIPALAATKRTVIDALAHV